LLEDCCSTATTKFLATRSITQSVHHTAIRVEESSQEEDNGMDDKISQLVNMATSHNHPGDAK